MSAVLFPDDILFTQRLLKAEGLYKGKLDGIWGPLTEQAARTFEQLTEKIRSEYGSFDLRSELHIVTLTLRAQKEARLFMLRLAVNSDSVGILPAGRSQPSLPEPVQHMPVVKIISGTRSYEQQNRLFRQGRYNNPGRKITNARGGFSTHNFGIAWDIGIFTEQGGYIPDGSLYDQVAAVALSDALQWGGRWTRFPDKPHYQLRLVEPVTVVRTRFETGKDPAQAATNRA